MIKKVDFKIKKLNKIRKYPNELFYKGNISILDKKLISIVGSRKPNQYAQQLTYQLASNLSELGIGIVSGGAIGIDTVAHKGAGAKNSIMVAGTGLDKKYPSINKNLIEQIEKDGLVLSQFKEKTPSLPRNFAIRNEIIVALGDILIVAYADENSGTSRSIDYAKQMGKEIYVLPHRIGQSNGTNKLLANNEAKAIYDINQFLSLFEKNKNGSTKKNDFLEYCKTNPTYDEAVLKYQNIVFEYELEGKIEIVNGKIYTS